MTNGYKIKEIATMFGLHPDTLRYYEEQGLVSPKREPNGYRSYSVQDICSLNIIHTLRRLEIPVSRISDYMQERTVYRTLTMLDEEEQLIEGRIAEFTRMRLEVQQRKLALYQTESIEIGIPKLITLPDRKCYRMESPQLFEQDVDVALRRLEQKRPELSRLMGIRQMGAVVDQAAVATGDYDHYSAVFFFGEQFTEWDSLLPGGLYAVILYQGAYQNLPAVMHKLVSFVEEQGYRSSGAPLELYHVDVHDTLLEEEYLTEVQLPVCARSTTTSNP